MIADVDSSRWSQGYSRGGRASGGRGFDHRDGRERGGRGRGGWGRGGNDDDFKGRPQRYETDDLGHSKGSIHDAAISRKSQRKALKQQMKDAKQMRHQALVYAAQTRKAERVAHKPRSQRNTQNPHAAPQPQKQQQQKQPRMQVKQEKPSKKTSTDTSSSEKEKTKAKKKNVAATVAAPVAPAPPAKRQTLSEMISEIQNDKGGDVAKNMGFAPLANESSSESKQKGASSSEKGKYVTPARRRAMERRDKQGGGEQGSTASDEDDGDDEEDTFSFEEDEEDFISSEDHGGKADSREASAAATLLARNATTGSVRGKALLRKILNQVSVSSLSEHGKELCDAFENGTLPRSDLVGGMLSVIGTMYLSTSSKLTYTNALPIAGLVRAVQLTHGNIAAAPVIEHAAAVLQQAIEDIQAVSEGTIPLSHLAELESTLENATIFVCALGALSAVSGSLVYSLVTLLVEAAISAQVPLRKKRSTLLAGRPSEPLQIACAAAAQLALKYAGDLIRRDASAQLNNMLEALRKAERDAQGSALPEETVVAALRRASLHQSIREVALGRANKKVVRGGPSLKKKVSSTSIMLGGAGSEAAAADAGGEDATNKAAQEEVLNELTLLVMVAKGEDPHSKKGSSQGARRVHRESVLTANTLNVNVWESLLHIPKPDRWYQGFEAASGVKRPRDEDNGSDDDDVQSEDSDDARANVAIKVETVKALRSEAKALSGQKLVSDVKRGVFKCLSTASDDMEAFLALKALDPELSEVQDIMTVIFQCAVQDSVYRPFYAAVIERIVIARKGNTKAVQYALWDRFKSIRIAGGSPDITGYVNLACLTTQLITADLFGLGLLRGLDIDHVDKNMGLFVRILLLRLIVALPDAALAKFFFGVDGSTAQMKHDLNTDTAGLRSNLSRFFKLYFEDDLELKKWVPLLFDVVADGTDFTTKPTGPGPKQSAKPDTPSLSINAECLKNTHLQKRIRLVSKALQRGVS